MTKLLQNLALAGVASMATVLSTSSAQAVVLFEGTIGDWAQAGSIQAGDLLFTYGDTDLNFGDTLIIETAGVGNNDYLLNVDLIASGTTVPNFFLDYTVTSDLPIVAVDLDSTVDAFPPNEVLETTYNATTLTSVGGSADVDNLIPPSTFVEVSNSYLAPEGGVIFGFENSFKPVPEPLTILGAGAAIAFGTGFKRKLGKADKK